MTVADILRRIVEQRRRRLGCGDPPPTPGAPGRMVGSPFLDALQARRGRAVIAEVKMGSPKLGDLRARVDPERQAELYGANGAAALSVVVEPDFFFGSYELLERSKAAAGLPVIAKDFLVHPRQIDSARDAGADAILLIAALYDPEELGRWADLARSRGMVPMIETHDEGDLEKLTGRDWELVGVNNRDLSTFAVDLEHSIARVSELPTECVKVAESGIRSRRDVERLSAAGFDAFLVGESLLLAADPGAALRALTED